MDKKGTFPMVKQDVRVSHLGYQKHETSGKG